jgi:Dolichyl-phosphate-mannose-protein mannosyltransferase
MRTVAGNMQTVNQETLHDTSLSKPKSAMAHAVIWSFLAVLLLATFYLATSIYIASHRLLWFDELFTVHIARLPDTATILTALSHGADSLPPLYYLVVRISDKLFGHGELAVRLLSTLAMVATLLITFDCARRLTDGLHGLLALALASGPLAGEGFEARSYAVYVMFGALSLWVWTYPWKSNKLSAILFGAALFLGVSFHYYAVLLLVPYALWEISRWKPWQPPSAKLVAGVIGVAVPAAVLSHFILSYSRKFSTGFWSRPSLRELTEVYSHIFVGGLFLLALIVIWIALVNRKNKGLLLESIPPGEAIGWLFLCLPLAGFIAAELKTNAFAVRYFLALVPGVAVAFACWTWRHFRTAPRVSMGIFLLLAGWGIAQQLYTVHDWKSVETPGTREYLSLETGLRKDGKRFFVFSDPFVFLEAQYYSKYPNECILLLPPDFNLQATARRSTPDPYMHQRVEAILSHYYPLQFWQLDQLREHIQGTALINPTPEVLDLIRKAGLQTDVRSSQPVRVVYLQ